jgi:hypothetical protein
LQSICTNEVHYPEHVLNPFILKGFFHSQERLRWLIQKQSGVKKKGKRKNKEEENKFKFGHIHS